MGSPSHLIHLPQYCRRGPGREAHIVIPLDMSVSGDSLCLCCNPYSWDDMDGGRYDLSAHVPLAGSGKRQACSAALWRRCYKLLRMPHFDTMYAHMGADENKSLIVVKHLHGDCCLCHRLEYILIAKAVSARRRVGNAYPLTRLSSNLQSISS